MADLSPANFAHAHPVSFTYSTDGTRVYAINHTHSYGAHEPEEPRELVAHRYHYADSITFVEKP